MGRIFLSTVAISAAASLIIIPAVAEDAPLGVYVESDAYEIIDGVKVYTRGARTPLGDESWVPSDLPSDKVIYGTDDRIDYYEEVDALRLEQADSTCGLVPNSRVTDNGNGTFTLTTSTYNVCPEEPFSTQPTVAFCTGFLVGPDILVTAGHCYDAGDLASTSFVFGFHMADASTPILTLDNSHLYYGIEVISQVLSYPDDYAVIRLDRPVTAPGAVPLQIRRSGTIANGEAIGVIGHPSGLPKKIAFGPTTEVYDNAPTEFFQANLDTYGGNSGSPVFNATTGIVEGILVRGATDFVFNGMCLVSNELPDASGTEDVTKTTTFMQFVPELSTSEGAISLDDTSYGCSSTVEIEVLDVDVSTSVTVTVTSTTGDSETVTLNEIGTATGIFRGTIETSALGVMAEDGTLQVSHSDTIAATYVDADNGSGMVASPMVDASISCADTAQYFAKFYPGHPNIDERSFVFTPNGSSDFYTMCAQPQSTFPANMSGATTLALGDDAAQEVLLTDSKTVSLYGVSYSSVFVGSNGYVTFAGADTAFDPILSVHFNTPRVSACFTDLAPHLGGTVQVKQFTNKLAIAYDTIQESGTGFVNTFMIELFFNGKIRITYVDLNASNLILGLSEGLGKPGDFSGTNFPGAANCDALDLRNNFSAFDSNGDGFISLAESGLAMADFDALEVVSDSLLTMDELLIATVGSAGLRTDVFIDFTYTGEELGSEFQPFNSMLEGQGSVVSGGDLWIEPGSTSGAVTLDKPMTLNRNGGSGTVTIGN